MFLIYAAIYISSIVTFFLKVIRFAINLIKQVLYYFLYFCLKIVTIIRGEDKTSYGPELTIAQRVYLLLTSIPFIDIFWMNCKVSFCTRNKLEIKRIDGVRNYSEKNGYDITIVEKDANCVVCRPEFYKGAEKHLERFQVPDIYIANIKDAQVIGGTASVVKDQMVLEDFLFEDKENRIDLRDFVIRKIVNNSCILEVSREPVVTIEKGISLVGPASSNYYHLLLETISRLTLIDNLGLYTDYPILIDEAVAGIPQYVEALEYINKLNREVIYVKKNAKISVKNLVIPSHVVWMPLNLYNRYDIRVSDFKVSELAIKNLRKAVENIAPDTNYKKIFISRKNVSNSRLINEAKAAKEFEKHGFTVVRTEEMSFKEQVACFKAVDQVSGASGAALANMIFAKPGVVLNCIIPASYEFDLYSTIVEMLGGNNLFLEPSITKRTLWPAADEIEISEDYLKDYLDICQ